MIDPVKRLFKVNKSSEQFTTGSSDFLLNQKREDKDVVRAAPVLPESRLDLRDNIMIISPLESRVARMEVNNLVTQFINDIPR